MLWPSTKESLHSCNIELTQEMISGPKKNIKPEGLDNEKSKKGDKVGGEWWMMHSCNQFVEDKAAKDI